MIFMPSKQQEQGIQQVVSERHYFSDASSRFVEDDNNVQQQITTAGYILGERRGNSMQYMKGEIKKVKGTIQTAEAAAVDMVLDDISSNDDNIPSYIHTDSNAVFNSMRDSVNYKMGMSKKVPRCVRKKNDFGSVMDRASDKYIDMNMSGHEIHMDCVKSHVPQRIQSRTYQDLSDNEPNDKLIQTINRGNDFIDGLVSVFSKDYTDFVEYYEI